MKETIHKLHEITKYQIPDKVMDPLTEPFCSATDNNNMDIIKFMSQFEEEMTKTLMLERFYIILKNKFEYL